MDCERIDLNSILTKIVNNISMYSTVEVIKMFGSQKVLYKPESDIDILIFVSDKSQYNEIIIELSRLSIDLSLLIHPIIVETSDEVAFKNKYFETNILNESILIYEKKS